MNKSKKSKKAGFTLAEVLITLGIIGVVAAMTLPTLIKNYQKQVWVNQLKKAYSTLGNAFNKMAADEGIVDWSQTSCAGLYLNPDASEILNKCFANISKQFNYIKKKDFFEPCAEDWCKAGADSVENSSSYGQAFFTPYILFTSSDCAEIMTTDGFTYYFVPLDTNMLMIYVDINGIANGPNIPGRDLFLFELDYAKSKLSIFNGGSTYPCDPSNLYIYGYDCARKVLQEGKMNY